MSRFCQSKIRNLKSEMVRRLLVALIGLLVAAAPASADIVIDSISPDSAWSVKVGQDITLFGSGMFPGMDVRLTLAGQPDIFGTFVDGTSTEMTFSFNLRSVHAGRWTVRASAPGGEPTTLPAALAIKSMALRRLTSWGGPVQEMVVREEIIDDVPRQIGYVARGSGLVILDLTDPTNMTELSSLDLGAMVFNLTMKNNYAFVWTWDTYLNVVDVSDVLDPRRVVSGISAERGSGRAGAMMIYGDTAYLIAGGGRPGLGDAGDLMIMDVTDPANLISEQAFLFPSTPGGAFALTIDGDYLYVVFWDAAAGADRILSIYDLSADPLAPSLVGSTMILLNASYSPTAVTVEGEFAYVTAHSTQDSDAMTILNVSNPAAPFVSGLFYDVDSPVDVSVSSGVAYLPGRGVPYDGLLIINVTDPVDPSLLATFRPPGGYTPALGVTVVGTTVYVFDEGEGIVAVDVSDAANPTLLGTWRSPAYPMQMAKEGDFLLSNDFWNGLHVLDVSDPRTPTLAAFRRHGERRRENGGIRVQDSVAYVAAGTNGLLFLDVSNPVDPVLLADYQSPFPGDTANFGDGLAVRENVLIARFTNAGNVIFDVTDPANPILAAPVGLLGSQGEQNWVISEDFIAYTANEGGAGGAVGDISDPYNSMFLGYMLPPARDIALEGNRLYLLAGGPLANFDWLEIYDLLPDGTPSSVGTASFKHGDNLAVRNGFVYLTGSPGPTSDGGYLYWGLSVFDVTGVTGNPNPVPVNHISTQGIGPIFVDPPYVYTGQSRWRSRAAPGLVVFQAAAPGDSDQDFVITQTDLDAFEACFSGPGIEPAEAICLVFDFELLASDCCLPHDSPGCSDADCQALVCADPFCCQDDWDNLCADSAVDLCPSAICSSSFDDDVDCDDWAALVELFIAFNPGAEVPTFAPCEPSPCPADLDGDGQVRVPDLIMLLGAWGPCAGDCPSDLDGDGQVRVPDLIILLGAWGNCEV